MGYTMSTNELIAALRIASKQETDPAKALLLTYAAERLAELQEGSTKD